MQLVSSRDLHPWLSSFSFLLVTIPRSPIDPQHPILSSHSSSPEQLATTLQRKSPPCRQLTRERSDSRTQVISSEAWIKSHLKLHLMYSRLLGYTSQHILSCLSLFRSGFLPLAAERIIADRRYKVLLVQRKQEPFLSHLVRKMSSWDRCRPLATWVHLENSFRSF